MSSVLFVLRGRPGLGHVVPGLAIAADLMNRGVDVLVATYDAGVELAQEVLGQARVHPLSVAPEYRDYPGLELYDAGFKQVGVLLLENNIKHLVLGGEYVLGFMAPFIPVRTAMIFNPEVLEDGERNRSFVPFFTGALTNIDLLLPLRRASVEATIRSFHPLLARCGPEGPFRLQDAVPTTKGDDPSRRRGEQILIANGGGMSFPADTSSYTAEAATGESWIDYTGEMTMTAVAAALESIGPEGEVSVFTTMAGSLHSKLAKISSQDSRLRVRQPSLAYYEALAHSDLAILRAGAGAIADLTDRGLPCILWPLPGHEEQFTNAQTAARNEGRWMARSADELSALIKAALATVSRSRVPSAAPVGANLEKASAAIIQRWGLV